MTPEAVKGLVEQIEALRAKATPGEWRDKPSIHGSQYRYVEICAAENYTTLELKPDDARLIASLVNNWPAIKSALSRLAAAEEREKVLREDAARYRWLCSMAWGVRLKHGWHELQFRSFSVEKWPSAMNGKTAIETTKQVADAAIDIARTRLTTEPTTLSVSPEGEQKEDTDGK